MLDIVPGCRKRHSLDSLSYSIMFLLGKVVSIFLADNKVNDLTCPRNFQKVKQLLHRLVESIFKIFIKQNILWNPHRLRYNKGQVVPLHIANEINKAGNMLDNLIDLWI